MGKKRHISVFSNFKALMDKNIGRNSNPLAFIKESWHYVYHLVWYKLFRPKGLALKDIQGSKMYINMEDICLSRLYLDGVIEKRETILFKDIIKDSQVFVDIGANIGYYSMIAGRLMSQTGMIYAYEPEPYTYSILCKNVQMNGYRNINTFNLAISDKKGYATLWTNNRDIALASMSKNNVSLILNTRKVNQEIRVRTFRLDDLFKDKKIDIIKIDTQGAEGLILEGAKEIMKSDVKILTEFWIEGLREMGTDPLELLRKVQGYGFKVYLIKEEGIERLHDPIGFFLDKRGEYNLFLTKD